MARDTLLVVDDDQRSLRVLEVSLKNAGYQVTTASDGREALERARGAPPSLVLCDTHMPQMDGYELCRQLKADPKLASIPFVFITEQSAIEDKIRGLELGVDDYLTKPIYIREVIARVKLILQRRAREALIHQEGKRFFGSLDGMGVVDLLQSIEMAGKTGVLALERPPLRGRIWFEKGHVIDAETSNLDGEEAVYRLLTWEEGSFEVNFRAIDREDRIQGSTQSVLMEGMRRMDEWGRMLEQLPSIDTVFEIDPEVHEASAAELPAEVSLLLERFDGHHTALQAITESAVPDLEALATISRLYFEGLLREVEGGAAPSLSRAQPTPPAPAPAPAPEPEPEPLPRAPSGIVEDLLDALAKAEGPRAAPPAEPTPAPPAEPPEPAPYVPPEPAPYVPPEPSPVLAFDPPLEPDDRVGDHDHEHAFFEAPTAEESEEEGFDDLEPPFDEDPDPDSKVAAYLAMGIVLVAIAGLAWFLGRDTVQPRDEPKTALAESWHRDALKGHTLPAKIEPIDAVWQVLGTPDASHEDASDEDASDAGPDDASYEDATPREDSEPTPAKPEETPRAAPPSPEPPSPESSKPPKADDSARFNGLLREGVSLHDKGRYRQAAAKLELALGIAPNDTTALLAYAMTLYELGRMKDALAQATRVAKASPRKARAHLIIGSVRQELGQKEAAVEAYQRYLSLAPNDANVQDVKMVVESLKR